MADTTNIQTQPQPVGPEVDEQGMTPEQIKRAELLDEYEKEVDGPRSERNAAIEDHDKNWSERWAKLQGTIDQAKSDMSAEFEKNSVPVEYHKSVLDAEAARLVEAHDVTHGEATAALEAELPRPKRWVDFLQEKAISGDPAVVAMLEEARQSPEPSFSGASDGQARPVLTDLTHKVDKSGVHYHRNGKEVLHDTGPRLNVKRLDDRDIAAALRIASQKFDLDKGLVLAGDAAFKMRSAEIAGRLGFPIQGHDPVIQAAWEKGRDSVNPLKQMQAPLIERGISGVARQEIDLKPVQFKLDPRLADQAEKLGVGIIERTDKAVTAEIPAERYLATMAAWRDTSRETLDKLAGVDLMHPESLDLTGIESRPDVQPLLEAGRNELSQLGKDLVLVRDAHALEARARTSELDTDLSADLYQTSQDRVAAAQERLQNEKELISRNVDEVAQAVEKTEVKAAEVKKVEEAKEVEAGNKERGKGSRGSQRNRRADARCGLVR